MQLGGRQGRGHGAGPGSLSAGQAELLGCSVGLQTIGGEGLLLCRRQLGELLSQCQEVLPRELWL